MISEQTQYPTLECFIFHRFALTSVATTGNYTVFVLNTTCCIYYSTTKCKTSSFFEFSDNESSIECVFISLLLFWKYFIWNFTYNIKSPVEQCTKQLNEMSMFLWQTDVLN